MDSTHVSTCSAVECLGAVILATVLCDDSVDHTEYFE